MTIQKSLSVLLILSQLVGLNLGFAQEDQSPSPELMLLERAVALEGMALPKNQMESQIQDAVAKYLAAAQPQGEQSRLSDALVQLGIYTPAEARSFLVDTQNASARSLKRATGAEDASQLKDALVSEIFQLALMHPAGAQFSACDVGESSMAVGIIGTIALTAASYVVGGAGACSGIPNCTSDANPKLAENLLYGAGGIALIAFSVVFISLQFTPQDGC